MADDLYHIIARGNNRRRMTETEVTETLRLRGQAGNIDILISLYLFSAGPWQGNRELR
ncbi:MAG TPA: hypothetical protein VKN18_16700 [Blastocatellia bacterium]|nr:hypothetical protein [Blastocatellia bacterium]